MSARRILFITQTAYVWGGVETWLERTVNALSRTGWAVTVGLVKGRRWHDPAAYLAEHVYADSLEIECRTATSEGRARAVVSGIEKVRPDIVVPVNVGDTFEAASRLKGAGRPYRLLVPVHALGRSYLHDLRRFGPTLDRAVAVNRLAQAAALEVSGLEADRVGYAPCGAEEPATAISETPTNGPFRLGFAGRLSDTQKNCHDVISVASELRRRGLDIRLEVAGDGPARGDLESQTRTEGMSDIVRFRGVVPARGLSEHFYSRLSALLITSSWETGPIVAWEAMLHGVPVVTTEFVGLRAEGALRDGVNCLVSGVGDVSGLASRVESLARSRDLALELGRAGRATAKKRYTWDVSTSSWVREFQECIESPIARGEPLAEAKVPSGRLDVWLGPSLAEDVRRTLRLGREQAGPGGEWPHSLSPDFPEIDEVEFFRRLEDAVMVQ